MLKTPQLSDNIEELKALLTAQFAAVEALKNERDTFQFEAQSLKSSKRDDLAEIARLGLLIDKLKRMLFGQKSEKLERHVRPKLTCRCCDTIVKAPAPSRPIPRSYAGPGLLSHVMVSKYLDHLPIYRQCQIYARQDVVLSDSTLGDWVGGVHDLLDPLMDKHREHVFAAKKLPADDTPIQVLAPGTGKT